jgi:hypothetical protein
VSDLEIAARYASGMLAVIQVKDERAQKAIENVLAALAVGLNWQPYISEDRVQQAWKEALAVSGPHGKYHKSKVSA